jgi:hypothetical protein
VTSVETFLNPLEAVDNVDFSTSFLHGGNDRSMRDRSVFPVVHTPYDFYERI